MAGFTEIEYEVIKRRVLLVGEVRLNTLEDKNIEYDTHALNEGFMVYLHEFGQWINVTIVLPERLVEGLKESFEQYVKDQRLDDLLTRERRGESA